MQNVTSIQQYKQDRHARVFFDRRELDQVLRVYGRMVAAGEWRDYAIGDTKGRVEFAIYRQASEMPLFRVIKCPAWARKQGAYAILGASGQILKRGHDLATVLRHFDKKRFAVID